MSRFDVAIIGGGPAGSSCAIKCASMGFRTALVEKSGELSHKPCGGITPMVTEVLLEELGLKIPEHVYATPKLLGVFYVPPSGMKHCGAMKNYLLVNLRRDNFDRWLRSIAELHDVNVMYHTAFIDLKYDGEVYRLKVLKNGCIEEVEVTYVVGADGAISRLRRILFPNFQQENILVLQEYWRTKGNLENYFYMIFNKSISPFYSYLIPKDDVVLIGLGISRGVDIKSHLKKFYEFLRHELLVEQVELLRRECAILPYGLAPLGKENAILIGDACGFCNPLSGEGIRYAIESGLIVADSINIAYNECIKLIDVYDRMVSDIKRFMERMRDFVISLDEKSIEAFIENELRRIYIF